MPHTGRWSPSRTSSLKSQKLGFWAVEETEMCGTEYQRKWSFEEVYVVGGSGLAAHRQGLSPLGLSEIVYYWVDC